MQDAGRATMGVRMATVGLGYGELQAEIARRMDALDELQEEAEHLGAYGDLMRMVAAAAYHRAADLILVNNERIARQLAAAGITLPDEATGDRQ